MVIAFDAGAEVAAITAALKSRVDPAYVAGMRRTVPSAQQAHAVRVPELRRLASKWWRSNKDRPQAELVALAEALWATEWREERIIAITLLGGRRAALATLDWDLIQRWSAQIDNWELVDHLAGAVTGPALVASPELLDALQDLASSAHVRQRRLAIVTLIEAARDDSAWLPELNAMAERLRGDRGPTMRKAVDWARRTAEKVAAKGA